jgi:hypothetical protein
MVIRDPKRGKANENRKLTLAAIAEVGLPVVCGHGKSHRISGVYPEQYELRSSLFGGLKKGQNPLSTNYR